MISKPGIPHYGNDGAHRAAKIGCVPRLETPHFEKRGQGYDSFVDGGVRGHNVFATYPRTQILSVHEDCATVLALCCVRVRGAGHHL